MTSQLAGLGTNVLTVRPGSTRFSGIRGGAGSNSSLKVEDALAIQSGIQGIADLSPISEGTTQVIAGNQNWRTDIQGVYAGYQQIQNWQLETGGFFTDADDEGARNVAVLGQTVAANLFSSPTSAVGQYVLIRNIPMIVVGVLASKGSGFGGDQDDIVFVPFNTARIRLFGVDVAQFDRDPGRAGRRDGPDHDGHHATYAPAPQDHAGALLMTSRSATTTASSILSPASPRR